MVSPVSPEAARSKPLSGQGFRSSLVNPNRGRMPSSRSPVTTTCSGVLEVFFTNTFLTGTGPVPQKSTSTVPKLMVSPLSIGVLPSPDKSPACRYMAGEGLLQICRAVR